MKENSNIVNLIAVFARAGLQPALKSYHKSDINLLQ